MTAWPSPSEVLSAAAEALARVAASIDVAALDRAAHDLARAERIVVTGIGKSGIVAAKVAGTLNSLRVPASHLAPLDAVHGDLGGLGGRDALMVLSWSGESGLLTGIVEEATRAGCGTVAVTRACTPLAAACRFLVPLPETPEAAPHGAPVVRSLVQLAVADALALAIARCRGGCAAEDFVRSHPAGALGRAALPSNAPMEA